MSVGRTIKSYLFWTHERGSFHYDVMVTLILAFIFLTPRIWNYGDHPQAPKESRQAILVQPQGGGGLVFDIPVTRVKDLSADQVQAQLESAVQPISGQVVVDRFQPLRDGAGHITAYRMWAHH